MQGRRVDDARAILCPAGDIGAKRMAAVARPNLRGNDQHPRRVRHRG